MEAILAFWPRTLKLSQFSSGCGRGGGEEIVQSEAGIAEVAGFLKGGGGRRCEGGGVGGGEREGGRRALIQVKEGGRGHLFPCCCTFPSISLSLHSGWL
jgi:hypothetical protein